MSNTERPVPLGHVAISIPDLDAAMEWYQDVLGLKQITPIGEVFVSKGGHFADQLRAVFGPELEHMRVGHLEAANGAAIELFQFIEPAYRPPEDNFDYLRGGLYHLCFTDPDVGGLSQKIIDSGGKARTELMKPFLEQEFEVRFCEDPWGTVIEIMSRSHPRIFANQMWGAPAGESRAAS